MTTLQFGPLLAVAGAACLIAWTPEGRAPEPVPRLALSAPKLASPFPDADPSKLTPGRAASLESPSTVGAIPASIPAPSAEAALDQAARSGKEVKVQLAYADLEGAAPALGALSAVAPHAEMAALEPSAPASAAPEPSAPAATPALPPPRTPQAVVLYKKGDVAGLMALASAATDADERSALEWAALRADAHPSFDSLAAFLKAHPGWPSRGWIRERQEAELAAHPQAPAEVAAFFASDAPHSSAGKIAAARAAQAMGAPRRRRKSSVAFGATAMSRRWRRASSCATSALRSPRPTTPIEPTACSTRATSALASARRRSPVPTTSRLLRPASRRRASR